MPIRVKVYIEREKVSDFVLDGFQSTTVYSTSPRGVTAPALGLRGAPEGGGDLIFDQRAVHLPPRTRKSFLFPDKRVAVIGLYPGN